MSSGQYEFCSAEWVAAAQDYVREAGKNEDLSGVELSFNEVFTDAPSHLNPDDQGRIGWYLRIGNGEIALSQGILDDTDLRITGDYQATVPLARMVFADNPELAQQAQQMVTQEMESGRMKREGNEGGMAELPWLAGLHDALARFTA